MILLDEIRKRDGFKNERHVAFPIKNFSNYLENELVKGDYISEIGYYPQAAYHYRERLDGADEAILFFCLEGRGTITLYSENNWHTYPIEPGDIFCIPPKTPHTYFSDKEKPWTILWVHFYSHLLENMLEANVPRPTMRDPQKKEMIESALIDLFIMEQKNFTLSNTIFMTSLLNHLLVTVYYYEDEPKNSKKNYMLTACIQYMKQQLHENLSLSDLTNHFNISPSYLNAIFKEETNKSPIEFFIKMKMDEACSLLRITTMKINEIAQSLGYSDPYYFSRLFRKTIGISPKSYRERFEQTPIDFLTD